MLRFDKLVEYLQNKQYSNMKQLKDYLHFYLCCNVEHFEGGIYKIMGVDYNLNEAFIKGDGNRNQWWELISHIKPILRPLSSMTKEQYEEWDAIGTIILGTSEWIEKEAEKTKYLLSKHFDLFGLIEAGLAIDLTKLTL